MKRLMIWLSMLLAVFAVNIATPAAAVAKSHASIERVAERHAMRHHRHMAGRHHHHHYYHGRHHHRAYGRHHYRHHRVRVIHIHHHHHHHYR